MSEVLDDREGLPITLSVLYMELGRRLGLKMEGVGMPGHFIVRHVPAKGDAELIDVYEGGKVMTKEEAVKKVEETTGQPFKDEFLAATPKRAIVARMLHNLLNLARTDDDAPGGLRYLDAILTATPDAVEERLMRAGGRWQSGDRDGALRRRRLAARSQAGRRRSGPRARVAAADRAARSGRVADGF